MDLQQRKENRYEAKRTHKKLLEVYEGFGFDIIKLPPVGVEQRLETILKVIKGERDGKIWKEAWK